jgi:hypothetical protein
VVPIVALMQIYINADERSAMIDHFIQAKHCPHVFADDQRILTSIAQSMSIDWRDIRPLRKIFTSNFEIVTASGALAVSGTICPRFISMSVYDGEVFAAFARLIATLVPAECALVLYDEALGCPIIDLTRTISRDAILINFGFV